MIFNKQDQPCHSEHIRCAQCKLREESVSLGAEILRCAQCKLREESVSLGAEILRCAQNDNTDFGRETS